MWGGMLTAANRSPAVAVHWAAIGDPESRMGPLSRYSTTPILLLALLAACGTEVAPVEQPPCDSRGTLIPGASRTGFLGEANCSFQSDISPGLATNRDRW